ncbi:MAG: DUF58 domain-containing protein [Crocinitomicaceae bacterium]
MNQKIDKLKLPTFGNLELLAKQIVEGFLTGLHKSPFHGFSVEFSEHRTYNQGESTRHIDWKLFAKTDKYYTKRYEAETNLRCQLVIDVSGSMFFPKDEDINKINFSIIASAALVELLKKQRDAVGLSLFSDELKLHTEAKLSIEHLHRIYNELETYLHEYDSKKNQEKTNLIDTLHTIAEITHKRSLIIIFSDFYQFYQNEEKLSEVLQHLKHNNHEVVLFHTTHKNKELDFNFSKNKHTFIDMETGEELKISPNELKEEYQKTTLGFYSKVKESCNQLAIDYIPVNIENGVEPILFHYLTKRKK